MSEILAWAGEHWFTTIILALIAGEVLKAPFYWPAWAFNRYLRSKNIAAHGWPSAPVDADGDVVYPKADD